MRDCRKTIVSAVAVLLTVQAASFAEQPHLDLELRQHYFGRTPYTDCHLRVLATSNVQRAELRCTANLSPLRRVTASRALNPAEREELSAFATASDLCGGGHIAEPSGDTMASDGLWDESLKAQCADGRWVLLLVTNNPSFTGDGARAKLLQRLHTMRQELEKRFDFRK